MNIEPEKILSWLTSLTPDKLAIVLPFIIGYIIVRSRTLATNWCWIVCPLIGAILFGILGPTETDKTGLQNWTFRFSVGLIFGTISAVGALGLHSVAFKWAADRWPMLKFLVLTEETPPTPPANPPV